MDYILKGIFAYELFLVFILCLFVDTGFNGYGNPTYRHRSFRIGIFVDKKVE